MRTVEIYFTRGHLNKKQEWIPGHLWQAEFEIMPDGSRVYILGSLHWVEITYHQPFKLEDVFHEYSICDLFK